MGEVSFFTLIYDCSALLPVKISAAKADKTNAKVSAGMDSNNVNR